MSVPKWITELTPIAPWLLAENDLHVVVDVDDATMAASGTDKRVAHGGYAGWKLATAQAHAVQGAVVSTPAGWIRYRDIWFGDPATTYVTGPLTTAHAYGIEIMGAVKPTSPGSTPDNITIDFTSFLAEIKALVGEALALIFEALIAGNAEFAGVAVALQGGSAGALQLVNAQSGANLGATQAWGTTTGCYFRFTAILGND